MNTRYILRSLPEGKLIGGSDSQDSIYSLLQSEDPEYWEILRRDHNGFVCFGARRPEQ